MSDRQEDLLKFLKALIQGYCNKDDIPLLYLWADSLNEVTLENMLKVIFSIAKEDPR